MNRINFKLHIRLALGYFIFAAILGVVLRSFQFIEMPVNYKFIVHTHSHMALLGWVYIALTTLLYKLYLFKLDQGKKYRSIFWFTQLTLVGMLLTFPFQGYSLLSIIFSTLFLFASYWFYWFFMKNVSHTAKKRNSYKCVKASLWYLVVSSMGPWALGAIMNTLGPESIWYRLAIYFYLHFQYNGWMILALTGVFFFLLEERQIKIEKNVFQRFFWSINLGIVLTFFLSTLWTKPLVLFYVLGGLGGIFQMVALSILIGIVIGSKIKMKEIFTKIQYMLIKTITVLLTIKMLLQLFTTLPYFAELTVRFLDFTIGYLHLTFLGVVTMALLLFLDYYKLLKLTKQGYWLFLTGFIWTEVLIFYRAIAAWWGFEAFKSHSAFLAFGSLIILLALGIILISTSNKNSENLKG